MESGSLDVSKVFAPHPVLVPFVATESRNQNQVQSDTDNGDHDCNPHGPDRRVLGQELMGQ